MGLAGDPRARLALEGALGDGEARDRKDRFDTYFSEAELDQLLAEAGFAVIKKEFGESRGFDGSSHPFVMIHATRA